MKNSHNRFTMTHAEIVGITSVTLVSILLVTHFLRTGEFLEISWRKAAGKNSATNQIQEVIPEPEIFEPVPDPPRFRSPPKTQSQDGFILLLSTNAQRSLAQKDENSGIAGMRLDDPKKHRVAVPTNAVWVTNTGRRGPGPGVKIAFP